MGRRFERFVGETFNVVRWTVLVGLFRYLSVERDSLTLKILYWASASLLFAYIASRFLLRPEIRIFQEKDSLAKSLTQSLVNFLVCVIVFLLVIILVEDLVSNVPQLKAGYGG